MVEFSAMFSVATTFEHMHAAKRAGHKRVSLLLKKGPAETMG